MVKILVFKTKYIGSNPILFVFKLLLWYFNGKVKDLKFLVIGLIF